MWEDDFTSQKFNQDDLIKIMKELEKQKKQSHISGWPLPSGIKKNEEEIDAFPTQASSAPVASHPLQEALDFITNPMSDQDEFFRQLALKLTYHKSQLTNKFEYKQQGNYNFIQHLAIYYLKNATSISSKSQTQVEMSFNLLKKIDSHYVNQSLNQTSIDAKKIKRTFLNEAFIFKTNFHNYSLEEKVQKNIEKVCNYLLQLSSQRLILESDGQYCYKLLERKNYILLSFIYELSQDMNLKLDNGMSFKDYINQLKQVDFKFDERLEKIYLDSNLLSNQKNTQKIKL